VIIALFRRSGQIFTAFIAVISPLIRRKLSPSDKANVPDGKWSGNRIAPGRD